MTPGAIGNAKATTAKKCPAVKKPSIMSASIASGSWMVIGKKNELIFAPK